jgi:AcrR family transcriptional regulator
MAESSETPPARGGRAGSDQETVLRAIDLLNRQGDDSPGMGELANELGFANSTIYHRMPGRQHLLGQARDEALDDLTAMIESATNDDEGTAYDRLRAAVRGSVEILVAGRPAVTPLRRRRHLDDRLAELVTAAVAEGAIRDDIPADLASNLLLGMLYSLTKWTIPGRYEAAVIADALTQIAFDGLRTARATQTPR